MGKPNFMVSFWETNLEATIRILKNGTPSILDATAGKRRPEVVPVCTMRSQPYCSAVLQVLRPEHWPKWIRTGMSEAGVQLSEEEDRVMMGGG